MTITISTRNFNGGPPRCCATSSALENIMLGTVIFQICYSFSQNFDFCFIWNIAKLFISLYPGTLRCKFHCRS